VTAKEEKRIRIVHTISMIFTVLSFALYLTGDPEHAFWLALATFAYLFYRG